MHEGWSGHWCCQKAPAGSQPKNSHGARLSVSSDTITRTHLSVWESEKSVIKPSLDSVQRSFPPSELYGSLLSTIVWPVSWSKCSGGLVIFLSVLLPCLHYLERKLHPTLLPDFPFWGLEGRDLEFAYSVMHLHRSLSLQSKNEYLIDSKLSKGSPCVVHIVTWWPAFESQFSHLLAMWHLARYSSLPLCKKWG